MERLHFSGCPFSPGMLTGVRATWDDHRLGATVAMVADDADAEGGRVRPVRIGIRTLPRSPPALLGVGVTCHRKVIATVLACDGWDYLATYTSVVEPVRGAPSLMWDLRVLPAWNDKATLVVVGAQQSWAQYVAYTGTPC